MRYVPLRFGTIHYEEENSQIQSKRVIYRVICVGWAGDMTILGTVMHRRWSCRHYSAAISCIKATLVRMPL